MSCFYILVHVPNGTFDSKQLNRLTNRLLFYLYDCGQAMHDVHCTASEGLVHPMHATKSFDSNSVRNISPFPAATTPCMPWIMEATEAIYMTASLLYAHVSVVS